MSVFIFALTLQSCSGLSEQELRDKVLQNHVITGQQILGCASFSGLADEGKIAIKNDFVQIKSQAEFNRLYKLCNLEAKPKKIDFSKEVCILGVFEPAQYTSIEFYKLIRGTDSKAHLYFLLDRKPLRRRKIAYPFCLVIMPKQKIQVSVELIYFKQDPITGFIVKPLGQFKTFNF